MTWPVWCECGCGWEGEDDVAQWCVEQAALWLFKRREGIGRAALAGGGHADEQVDRPAYDPEHAEAMAKAQQFAQTGLRN